MWFLRLHDLVNHISLLNRHWPEIAITAGAVLLVGSAASCACSPSEEKDDLFHHETM